MPKTIFQDGTTVTPTFLNKVNNPDFKGDNEDGSFLLPDYLTPKTITKAQYDALTATQKMDGTIYFVSEGQATKIMYKDKTMSLMRFVSCATEAQYNALSAEEKNDPTALYIVGGGGG